MTNDLTSESQEINSLVVVKNENFELHLGKMDHIKTVDKYCETRWVTCGYH
jgi:hypothetical protein